VLGDSIALVDSGEETALEALRILKERSLLNDNHEGNCRYYLSDLTPSFSKVGAQCLGEPNLEAIRVTIKES